MSSFRRLVAWCFALLRKTGVLAVPLAVLAIARPPVDWEGAQRGMLLVSLGVVALAMTGIVALLARER